MASAVADVSAGLEARLGSSLPLNSKCRLAVNIFTSDMFLPQKEAVVLDWVHTSLDMKYRDRINSQHTESDTLLWETLDTCLSHYLARPPTTPYTFNTVPDLLLNILPCTDISITPIMSSISHLLTLSSSSCPDHDNWSSLLSELLSLCLSLPSIPSTLVSSLHTALGRISLDLTQDHSSLLVHLSRLHTLHPHPSLQALVASILFSDPHPYSSLFSHLSGAESKYQPHRATSLLLSTLRMSPVSPLLLLSSCPAHPPWLRPGIFSLLLSMQGCAGLVDRDTVEGARLAKSVIVPAEGSLHGLFSLTLPLDLSLEVVAGLSVAKIIQESVKELTTVNGITEEVADIISIVHQHHPQVLEPLVPLILGKHLELPRHGPVVACVLDVMLKLRQLPKLLSKLFLYLRNSDSSTALSWAESDLELLGSALCSLPRVQYLEMWKTLNYHLTTDILSLAPVSQTRADRVCSVLSPLLSMVLQHSQLADHNLPSSLLPRIQDLMDTTLSYLQAMLGNSSMSRNYKIMLVEVGSALVELSKLLLNYRELKETEKVAKFTEELFEKVLKDGWEDVPNVKRFVVPRLLDKPELIIERTDFAEEALIVAPTSIKQIPDETLLKVVRGMSSCPASLLESPVFCAAVIYTVMEKVNKEENFFIPQFEYWRTGTDMLDSYLGKSLVTCLASLFHSDLPPALLSQKDLEMLGNLPLEDLPSTLKLWASLACLTQVFRKGELENQTLGFGLLARCLETTDLFRFVDAGMFLNRLLEFKSVPEDVIKVVTKSIARFTKPIRDVEAVFILEDVAQENNSHLRVCVHLLASLCKSVCDGAAGSDKKEASKLLADKISKHVLKNFKKRNLDNSDQIDLFCEAAAKMVQLYSKTGLGKMSKMVHKMVELSFSETCKAFKSLLGEICSNLNLLDSVMLPEDWKVKGWEALAASFDRNCEDLARAILKISSPEELDKMLNHVLKNEGNNLFIWKCVVSSEVSEDCMKVKADYIEKYVTGVCKLVQGDGDVEMENLPDFLSSVFSSSPPCVSTQTETLCLGTLLVLPSHRAPAALSALATFLSHRGTLSTRTIHITTLVIRNFLSNTASTPTLHALQRVLGLFSRHKTDYSSVVPHLVADMLHILSSSPSESRATLTTSLFPLLDMLDTHSFQYLSANLAPATNEIFKHLLSSYHSSHKFKGKV